MNVQFRRPRALSIARAQEPGDRRQYQRYVEYGMVVRIGAQLFDVHDLSIGGLRITRCEEEVGAAVSLQLIPREGRKLMLPETVNAEIIIVGQCEKWSRLKFSGLTFTLAKFLIKYMARRHGVEPFIVK